MTDRTTRYKLLALDLDGTLIDTSNTVSQDVRQAIARADRAGLALCLATGRSYVETIGVWKQLDLSPPYQPMVLIGGALVSEPDTGRTLFQRTIAHDLACEFADRLAAEGFSAMAIVDAWRHGVDYFFAHGPDAESAAKRWFWKMNVKVHSVRRLGDAVDMPCPLRISTVVDAAAAPKLAERLVQTFGTRLNVHPILAPNYGVTIVEAFAKAADKFQGVMYVAQAMRAGAGAVAVVGDDVNDLPMIRAAGMGAAMAHAPAAVRQAAKHVVPTGKLAEFIDELVAGRHD
jgi:Cof subfamily protein (haloacid dehalogenase superfamily)